jgi:hypothetical protein
MAHFHIEGKEKIIKLFKDTQIKIALRTRNTIHKILKQHSRIDKCNKSGIYEMKCLDCPLIYVGQNRQNIPH